MLAKKPARKLLAFILAVVLLVGCVGGILITVVSAYTKSNDYTYNTIERLGDYGHYNGIVFDAFTTEQADSEGAVAAGGNFVVGTSLGSYDIGGTYPAGYSNYVHIGQYTNPNNYPTLLLGASASATISIGKSGVSHSGTVYHGGLVMRSALLTKYNALSRKFSLSDAKTATTPDAVVDSWFSGAKTFFTDLSNVLATTGKTSSNTITLSKFQSYSYTSTVSNFHNTALKANAVDANGAVTGVAKILTINVDCGSSTSQIRLNAQWQGFLDYVNAMDSYDIVVFNFNAKNVLIDGDMLYNGGLMNVNAPEGWYPTDHANLQKVSEKLIFNFPNATKIYIDGRGIAGSLYAPNAHVECRAGSINGQLVANQYTSRESSELHAVQINRQIFSVGQQLVGTPDEPATLEVVVQKQNSAGAALSGAVFSLYKQGGTTAIKTKLSTGSNGKVALGELEAGSYELAETTAPSGYQSLTSRIPFTVYDDNGTLKLKVNGSAVSGNTVTVTNTALQTAVELYKIDAQTNSELAGAVFSLYQGAQLLQAGLTSGTDGKVVTQALPAGSYTLKETQAPAGYQALVEDIAFTLQLNTGTNTLQLFVNNTLQSGLTLTIQNTALPKTADITIQKIDAEDEGALAGATFALFVAGADTALSEGHTTNQQGEVTLTGLLAGDYFLRETAAPTGYHKLQKDIPFSIVEQDGQAKLKQNGVVQNNNVITVANEPLVGFQLTKVLNEPAQQDERFVFQVDYYAPSSSAIDTTLYAVLLVEAGQTQKTVSFTGFARGTYLVHEQNSNMRYTLDPAALESNNPGCTVNAADGSLQADLGKNTSLTFRFDNTRTPVIAAYGTAACTNRMPVFTAQGVQGVALSGSAKMQHTGYAEKPGEILATAPVDAPQKKWGVA